MEDLLNEVSLLYEEYIYKTENRGASYGELAYIQNLSEKELNDLYKELISYEL